MLPLNSRQQLIVLKRRASIIFKAHLRRILWVYADYCDRIRARPCVEKDLS
jgi:hypothetical protein